MSNDDVVFERSAGGAVLHVVLNRPAKRNAITPAMARAIHAELQALDTSTHLVVFGSAAAGTFSSGFDIGHLSGGESKSDPAAPLYELFDFVESARVVTVAFADGMTVGGGVELFTCCDLRLASPQSTFRMPPAKLSLVYERAGMARFVRRAGITATTEMFLSGRALTATEAQQCGLVTRLITPGELDAYCNEVLTGAPLAQRAMKEVLRSVSRTPAPDPGELEGISELKQSVLASADHAEAIAAAREKRAPRFKGR